jgi:hypothetical protein
MSAAIANHNGYLDHKGVLVKDLWPAPFANVVDKTAINDLTSKQIVPTTFTDVCEWAYVDRKIQSNDHTRLYYLLYKNPGGVVNTVYPVVVRLQGILGRFELSPLGTWNGCVMLISHKVLIPNQYADPRKQLRVQFSLSRCYPEMSMRSGSQHTKLSDCFDNWFIIVSNGRTHLLNQPQIILIIFIFNVAFFQRYTFHMNMKYTIIHIRC